jgi:hypothetical protein
VVGGCWLGYRLPIGWCYWGYPIVPISPYHGPWAGLIGAYTHSYLAGACVSHCSRRQTTGVATSTAHAEYLAAFECGREAIRIRVLLKDMGLPQLGHVGATTIFEDNETCIRMSEAESSTPRTQYIDVRYHWLREAVVVVHDKSLRLVHCSTTEMVADALTKPLGSFEIARFHGSMSGIKPISHPPLGGEYVWTNWHVASQAEGLSTFVWRLGHKGPVLGVASLLRVTY